VRAKQQSSNALGMYSSTESSFSTAPDYATDFDLSIQVSHPPHPTPPAVIAAPVLSEPTPGVADGDGLLHDARNLIGTLGLYCLAPVRVPSAIPSSTGIGAQSGNTKSLGATKERWLSC
jgi:hypothetical protein